MVKNINVVFALTDLARYWGYRQVRGGLQQNEGARVGHCCGSTWTYLWQASVSAEGGGSSVGGGDGGGGDQRSLALHLKM